jgi:succinyl-CoA synthetase beta subunit
MVLYEYEAKILLRKYNIPLSDSMLVTSPKEAQSAQEKFHSKVVIKAQILGGKRGKRGLIQFGSTPEEVVQKSKEILARSDLPEGFVKQLLIEPAIDIAEELYLGVLIDRSKKQLLVLFSPQGGIEIEETARISPEDLMKIYFSFSTKIFPYLFFEDLDQIGVTGKRKILIAELLSKLVMIARKEDLLLLELNPFVFTKNGKPLALDARISLDESALFRHSDQQHFQSLKDGLSAQELQAKQADLAYVQMEGDIGMISCGAGLSMATCDLIALYGGSTANFLDVGGGASPEKVEAALQILFAQSNIKGILINVFGGITRGDQVAQGIITALKKQPNHVPVVVRLIGTNDVIGVKILAEAGINAFTEMEPAVQKIMEVLHK